ncbi:hypothetical protein FQN52_006076 [Onygenales sp. PD_12]|nr:hypothetical protein FQN52_006076 [Onygenales sp. PD_12]
MKFAKELEEDLVPEWRAKYLNYKAGKKKVKAISRALRHAEQSPFTNRRRLSQIFFNEDGPNSRRNSAVPAGWSPHHPVERPEPALAESSRGTYLDTLPVGIPERTPLYRPRSRFNDQPGSYGSIVASPPQGPPSIPPSLELPDPALDPEDSHFPPRPTTRNSTDDDKPKTFRRTDTAPPGSSGMDGDCCRSSILPGPGNIFRPRRNSIPARMLENQKALLKSVFTSKTSREHATSHGPAEEFMALRLKETEFFAFLDKELAKIESFYRFKENEATERLATLRTQLHLMRDTRLEEIRRNKGNVDAKAHLEALSVSEAGSTAKWKTPLAGTINRSRSRRTSKAMEQLATPSGPVATPSRVDGERDFVRRHDLQDVSYRSAKRKLKVALLEFYRGLELLKSYADLNRKAFRKMNKKYDKVTNARPTGRYISEKVNKAWFVQSEVVENHLVQVEDLYARYFERGNRKAAVRKLRGKTSRSEDYSPNSFRNGLMFAGGLVFGIQGLAYGVHHLFYGESDVRLRTAYLLQIYGITVTILLFPARILYHRSRRWWAYSNWRLLLAGLYPVEFRDFFLGDMYCSQTYAMSNIALFFCLYSNGWDNAPTCNSSHSRIMGFLSTLPSIWRAFQCLRRYRDTKNIFPHIVNLGKYSCSILYYMTLSLYRMRKEEHLRAIFITCACINAIYTSTWDLAMDWSLGNPYAKHPFLRDSLGFRRRWVYYIAMVIDPILRFNWVFYAAFTHDFQHSAILSFMVSFSEVCRRGMWSIFRVENEHCTNVSRFRASRDVPLPYDVSSPSRPSLEEEQPTAADLQTQESIISDLQAATSADLERAGSDSLRQRRSLQPPGPQRTLTRVGTMLATAHAQDFERKKRPGILNKDLEDEPHHPSHDRDNSSTDDEDADEEEDDGSRGDEVAEEHDFEEAERYMT